jgi:pantetheine-phosphate adenylyltransferase
MRTAIYAGSFDPVTNGHQDLMIRASRMFDKLIVAVATSSQKGYMFSLEERIRLVADAASAIDNATVVSFDGLLAQFVQKQKAVAIIRGLRAVSDFEYEFQLALMNRQLVQEAETVFLMPSLKYVYLSSSIVKEVALNGGDISSLVPKAVQETFTRMHVRRP